MIDPLKLLREQLKTRNQVQLAAEIGVSKQFLNEVLHGTRRPSGRILEYLGLREETKLVPIEAPANEPTAASGGAT